MTEGAVPRMKRNGARLFKNPPQPHMCIQDFIQVYHYENNILLYIIVIRLHTICRKKDMLYNKYQSIDLGHYSSMLCKCIVLGQNCNASQTFTACATLWRYESTTTSHKDGSDCIRCNGQSRSLTNEWQKCSRSKG
jgi:hypothetical protein